MRASTRSTASCSRNHVPSKSGRSVRCRLCLPGRREGLALWEMRHTPRSQVSSQNRCLNILERLTISRVSASGAGAGQAIEDAAVLGVMLPLGTTRDEVPKRLEAYQTVRKARTESVCQESLDQYLVKEKLGLLTRCKQLCSFTDEPS